MATYYVVPDPSGYGDWAIKKKGRGKAQDAQTQNTAKNTVRNQVAEQGDQVYVYGNRSNHIVDSFEVR